MKVAFVSVGRPYPVSIWTADSARKCAMLDSTHYLATMIAIHSRMRIILILVGLCHFAVGCKQSQSGDWPNEGTFDHSPVYSLPNSELDIIPDHARLTSQGLVVYDKLGQRIVLIDMQTNRVVRQFGSSRGKGPGEHEMVFDIYINDSSEKLYALDPRLYRISEYNLNDGVLSSTISVKNDLTRIASLDSSRLLVAPVADEFLFHIIGTDGDTTFNRVPLEGYETKREYAMSTIGNWSVAPSGIHYFPVMDSRIFKFEFHSGIVVTKSFSTPDTFRFRKSIDMSTSSGVMLKAPDRPYVRVGAAKSNDYFVTASRVIDLAKRELVSSTLHVFDANLNVVRAFDLTHFQRNQPQSITANDDLICIQFTENVHCYDATQILPEQ